MDRLGVALMLGVLATAGGCGGDSPAPLAVDVPVEPVPEVLQRQWAQGNYVLRTSQSWSDAWNAAPSLVIPETAPPQIDFAAHTLVGVDTGLGPNGCAGLAIRRAIEEDSRILVEYTQSDGTPMPGAGCTTVVVQLVAFAKIPATAKPVTFVRNDG